MDDSARLGAYPNLAAIVHGTISGSFRDWPLVRGELRRFIDTELPAVWQEENSACEQELLTAFAEGQTLNLLHGAARIAARRGAAGPTLRSHP